MFGESHRDLCKFTNTNLFYNNSCSIISESANDCCVSDLCLISENPFAIVRDLVVQHSKVVQRSRGNVFLSRTFQNEVEEFVAHPQSARLKDITDFAHFSCVCELAAQLGRIQDCRRTLFIAVVLQSVREISSSVGIPIRVCLTVLSARDSRWGRTLSRRTEGIP